MRVSSRLAVEAVTSGVAYGAGLCWVSVCLLASFRPRALGTPYWQGIPYLRSDTSGFLAFMVLAICLCASEYLRLHRRAAAKATVCQNETKVMRIEHARSRTWMLFALAASETVAVLSTGLVGYLSVNAVTHPSTLELHVTHLLPWPSEGTVRVIALLLAAGSVSIVRYLWSGAMWQHLYVSFNNYSEPRAHT